MFGTKTYELTLEAWLRKNRGEMRASAIKAFKTDVLGAALKWVATK